MTTVKIVVQGPLEEIQRILPRLEGETIEVQINNNGSSLMTSQPVIAAPHKDGRGAGKFWASLTKEERSKEMARRQQVARKNRRKKPMGGVA